MHRMTPTTGTSTTILVTGESGFIGRHLSAALRADGFTVHGLSRRSGTDISDAEAVRETIRRSRPSAIYHLAGPSFVPDSRRDPERFRAAHVDGTRHLLEAARTLQPFPRILLAGTADSYQPDPGNLPFDEETPIEPENPYAEAKLLQEQAGLEYHRVHGMPIVRVRLFNVIGPGQESRYVASNFAMQAARIALGHQPPRIETGDLRVARDFIDWRDAVAALRMALVSGKPGEVYNVASGRPRTLGELVTHFQSRVGVPIDIIQPEALDRPGQSRLRYGSAEKLRTGTDWKPQHPLESTLDAIYDDWLLRLVGHEETDPIG